MASDSLLRRLLESPSVSMEDILSWYQGSSSLKSLLGSESLEEEENRSCSSSSNSPGSLRPGFVLSLLNFIREESTPILRQSQCLCLTPSKGNHPSKYELQGRRALSSPVDSQPRTQTRAQPLARRALQVQKDNTPTTPSSASPASGRRSELQLSDFIVKRKASSQKTRKRIELTPAEEESPSSSSLPHPAFSSPQKTPSLLLTPLSPIHQPHTPKKPSFPLANYVEPQRESVTQSSTLDKLIRLYSVCLDENLVPNLLVELYLLMELLTLRDNPGETSSTSTGLFASVHNCVYFASHVLEAQCDRLLQFVDRVTLRFLMDNPRLEAFVPELKPRLAQIYERKKMSLHSTSLRGGSLLMGDSSASCQSVRFQSETDNRANFPSAQSFQYFRKQRDLFYEILRDSEQEERTGKTPDTKKKIKLKVDNLLASSSPHPVNLIHLARLFQSQLIQTCSSYLMNGYLPEESALADTLDEMQELKLIDPLKYNRLQTRFTTPSMFGGPCPKPDFSGPQEFFRDFIANCNNHQFMEHLKVSLAGNIMELNASSSFSPWDKADPRSLCLLEEEVMESVTSLRILGKYMGYLESLSYLCPVENIPQELLFSQISLRKNVTPTLDLIKILNQAIQEERLVLTLPWIVEYCSMIDPISVHLPYYQELFTLLVTLYRSLLLPKEKALDPMNNFFLCLSLGWLFENALFPRELLLHSENDLKHQLLLPTKKRHPSNYLETSSLDKSPCVSQNLLYTSCPYLSELKAILGQFLSKDPLKVDTTHNASTPAASSPRFTPSILSSAEKSARKVVPGNSNRSGLQMEMEENFFHNQPASLRKTLDFVAERVASNSVKKIRTDLIPGERKRVSALIKSNLLEDASQKTEEKSLLQIENYARESCDKIRSSGPEWISQRMKESIAVSLRNLLAEDTSPVVLQTSIKITERKTLETACQWIEDHVTLRYFLKDYQSEFNQLLRAQSLKNEEQGEESAELLGSSSSSSPLKRERREEIKDKKKKTPGEIIKEVVPPSKLLIGLKMDLKEMLLTSNPLNYNQEYVIGILNDIQLCLGKGGDSICSMGLRGFESFTVDWAISLITFCPSCMTSDVFDKLMEVWTKQLFCQSQVMTILCPRNMVLLGQSTQPMQTWQRLEVLLSRLLKSKLLLPIALEDQCIQLLKQEWPEAILKKFASCLQGVVSVWKAANYGSRSDDDEIEFVQLMDWIVWYCSSVEDYLLDKQDFPELV